MADGERVFLGAAEPVAHAAANAILERIDRDRGGFDLSDWIVVVPGARAGRLLLAALLERAAERGTSLDPPVVLTPASLVEGLRQPVEGAKPAATALERRSAWAATLLAADRRMWATLGLGDPIDPMRAWLVAKVFLRTEDALDAGDLGWGDAAEAMVRIGGDADRLAAIADLAKAVNARLAEAGLTSPGNARSTRLRQGAVIERPVVLAGVLELGPTHEAALASAAPLLILVAADPEHADRFDRFGRPNERWLESDLAIADRQVVVCETPHDQASAALAFVAEAADRYGHSDDGLPCDAVAIGVGDPSLIAALELAGREAGVEIHVASGVPIAATRVGRTLAALACVAEEDRAEDWAALLRRPLLAGRSGCDAPTLVGAFDWLRSRMVPPDDERAAEGGDLADDAAIVRGAMRSVEAMLEPLRRGTAGLPAVVEAVAAAAETTGADEIDHAAVNAALESARAIAALDSGSASLRPTLDRGGAIRLLVDELAETAIPMAPRDRSVEAIGWLELLYEPASEIVVLGLNEGCVPSGGADPLLPEAARRALGLPTSATRARRDAAILAAIARRAPSARFVAGRKGIDGEPLIPSRLLFAVDDERLAQRTLLLCDGERVERFSRRRLLSAAPRNRFTVPEPGDDVRRIASMRVTDFRVFLKSPLRWWLERVERLASIEDEPREMPLPSLGTMVHTVLDEAAREGDLERIDDPLRLAARLEERVDAALRRDVGSRLPAAVRLQRQGLVPRFAAFARWQVAAVGEGWRIADTELALPDDAALAPGDVASMRLRGRVDRLDVHPGLRRWRLIDYKTSDAGTKPREAHLKEWKNAPPEWLDLQLPLYVHALRTALEAREPNSSIDVGYVRLSAEESEVGWISASFSDAELRSAVERANEVVRAIRAGEFEAGESLGPEDAYAGILQVPVLRRDGDGDADAEETA